MPTSRRRSAIEPLILLALTAVALAVSGVHSYDRTTWVLEVARVLMGSATSPREVHDRELARLTEAPKG